MPRAAPRSSWDRALEGAQSPPPPRPPARTSRAVPNTTMARRVWQAYERFLLANASQITALESSLRSITYVLPGRFKDAELYVRLTHPAPAKPVCRGAADPVYAGVHLLGMYHDSVLFKIVYSRRAKQAHALVQQARDELSGDLPKLSLHARYTNFWHSSSQRYGAAAVLLMIVEATQLLVEMVARRKLRERAWDVVVSIELLKALLRFALVEASQRRPVVHPPLPQREIDPALLERSAASPTYTWRGERTGVIHTSINALVPLPNAARDATRTEEPDIYEYLLSHTLTDQDVAPPAQLVRKLQGAVGRVAEAVYILRPLVYVLALRKWGKRDAKPFALSLVLELLAASLRRRSFYLPRESAEKMPVPPLSSVSLMLSMLGIENSFLDWLAGSLSRSDPRRALAKPISAVEGDEWAARDRSFWWYLLRGPVWYNHTRPKLEGLVRRTEGKRLIGVLASIGGDYLPLVDEYYYYTAA